MKGDIPVPLSLQFENFSMVTRDKSEEKREQIRDESWTIVRIFVGNKMPEWGCQILDLQY